MNNHTKNAGIFLSKSAGRFCAAAFYIFAAAALLISQQTPSQAQQQTVFKRAAISAVTVPTASAALPNIGQSVHILTAIFPAAVADVTGFVLRVEASFDNTTYFPISEDLTTATYNGSFAYAITRANGVYPFVRLRYVTAAAPALTANYTGSLQPIGQITLSGTRYIAASPLAAPSTPAPSGASIAGICLNIENTCYINGKKVVPLITSDWTSVELEGTTVRTDGTGFINLYQPFGTTNKWQMVCRSIPATPFDVVLHLIRNTAISGSDPVARTGIMLRESSTGKLWTYHLGNGGGSGLNFFMQRWTNSSSLLNEVFSGGIRLDSSMYSLRITAGASTRSISVPDPSGLYYSKLLNFGQAISNTDHFTTAADQLCFGFGVDNGNYAGYVTLAGYEVF